MTEHCRTLRFNLAKENFSRIICWGKRGKFNLDLFFLENFDQRWRWRRFWFSNNLDISLMVRHLINLEHFNFYLCSFAKKIQKPSIDWQHQKHSVSDRISQISHWFISKLIKMPLFGSDLDFLRKMKNQEKLNWIELLRNFYLMRLKLHSEWKMIHFTVEWEKRVHANCIVHMFHQIKFKSMMMQFVRFFFCLFSFVQTLVEISLNILMWNFVLHL